MGFLETIESARAFLERNGRVSLRVLKLEFELSDDQAEALVEELVDVQQVASREGKGCQREICHWRSLAELKRGSCSTRLVLPLASI